MRLGYDRRRLAWFGTLLKQGKVFAGQERSSAAELARLRQARLERLLAHAREHSAFYRERIPAGPLSLERVPPLEKAEMMARYDDIVTDPRLRRDDLLRWIETRRRDEYYAGRYRVMTTSGSSGRKGLFVYDRAGWSAIGAQFLRASGWMGLTPGLPRRRLAMLRGASLTHMSTQGAASLAVGVYRVLGLSVTQPIEEQVAALNAFQPQFLNAYPSAAMRLAEEQEAGRLRLSLTGMSTSSELRSPAMTERLVAAFGVHPFDLYATTEGLFGAECDRHDGIHLFEDASVVENVGEDGRPVPPGTPGARVLVTNLHNLVQPIIRLEVADVMTMHPEPCACGRALVRAAALAGRCDDLLSLPARGGGTVTVLPAHFSVITRDRAVREFQVRQEPGGVRILVVPCGDGDPQLEARLQGAVTRALAEAGADARVEVECCRELTRRAGKLQAVVGLKLPRVNVAVPVGEAELDDVELAAWRGLVRVHAALVKELDAELEARHGLPLTSYEVLCSLRRAPEGKLRMAELAEHALLSRSGMTRLIDRLEREGMVARSTCDKDGRGCYAVVTVQGREAFDSARSTYIAVVRSGFLRHYAVDELREVALLLQRAL